MSRGEATRQQILVQALHLSSEVGIEGLTVGGLAKTVGMSKSGLFAHFGSKEDLQCAVLDAAAALFIDRVIAPALKQPRGLPRIERLYKGWIAWETTTLRGGCPFIGAATELDDRPGKARERLVGHLLDLLSSIERTAAAAIQQGHFREDLDLRQFAYSFWANVTAYHHYARLLDEPDAANLAQRSFDAMIDNARA